MKAEWLMLSVINTYRDSRELEIHLSNDSGIAMDAAMRLCNLGDEAYTQDSRYSVLYKSNTINRIQ